MPLVHSRASQPRLRQWKKFNGHMFPGFRLAAAVVTMLMHFDVADVVAPRADAVVVAFHLEPGAVFDVDCASGVGAGVDVSVDVDMLMLTLQMMLLLKTRIVLDAQNRSSQDQNVPKPEF